MVPSFLRFLQGYAVFENGDLSVAVAFVLGLLPFAVRRIRSNRSSVVAVWASRSIQPGFFFTRGGVGGNFDGGHRRAQRRAPPHRGLAVMPGRPSLPPHFSPIFNLLTGRAQRRFASVRAMLFTLCRR